MVMLVLSHGGVTIMWASACPVFWDNVRTVAKVPRHWSQSDQMAKDNAKERSRVWFVDLVPP